MNTRSILSGDEMEFLAEEELVSIIPKFSKEKIEFLEGEYGPFRPNFPIQVPLWLAIQFKKKNLCQIRPPDFMDLETLLKAKHDEANDETFKPLPYHYRQIASLILENAASDVPKSELIRSTLLDIADIRNSKIKTGLKKIQGGLQMLKLNNISSSEMNEIRPLCLEALNCFRSVSGEDAVSYSQSQQSQSQQSAAPQDGADDDSANPAPRKLRRYRD